MQKYNFKQVAVMTVNYNLPEPSFRNRKAFINSMHKSRASNEARGDVDRAITRVKNFLSLDGSNRDKFGLALAGLSNFLHPRLYLEISDILEGKDGSLERYKNLWGQYFFLFQLKFICFNYSKWKNPEVSVHGRLGLPQVIAEIPPMLAIFGNRALFKSSLNNILDAFDKGMFANTAAYVTQLFMLQLAEAFMGYAPRDWKSYLDVDPRKEEPLFNELLQRWDTEDLSQLEPLLVQLLNRHTYKASCTNPDGGCEFDGYSEQFPIELLFIFRLRKWKGLANPNIKHHLTEPPFHELPAPLEVIEFDELTVNFVKEVRSLFPDLDQAVAAVKGRDWDMLI